MLVFSEIEQIIINREPEPPRPTATHSHNAGPGRSHWTQKEKRLDSLFSVCLGDSVGGNAYGEALHRRREHGPGHRDRLGLGPLTH